MSDTRRSEGVYEYIPAGRRNVGRPRKIWRYQYNEDGASLDLAHPVTTTTTTTTTDYDVVEALK